MHTPKHPFCGQSGQAMIEVMIGIILILIVVVGAVQFLIVSDTHSGIDGSIRGKTGFLAMSPFTLADSPSYFQTWDPGGDGQRFTADDKPLPAGGLPPNTIAAIANYSVRDQTPTDWNTFGNLAHPSSLDALHAVPVPLVDLDFVTTHQAIAVPIEDIAQQLFYGNAFATVQEDVWLPIMKGLY